jgi:hypothetical protein
MRLGSASAGGASARRRDAFMNSTVTATVAIPIPVETITVVAPPPELVSQLNVAAVCGIPVRTYLETIRRPGFPLPVTKLGALRLVDRAAFVAWLREGAALPEPAPAGSDPSDAQEEKDLLERMGLEETRKRAIRR